jgi:hypothetical protein
VDERREEEDGVKYHEERGAVLDPPLLLLQARVAPSFVVLGELRLLLLVSFVDPRLEAFVAFWQLFK